jgi:glutathione S-transferase
MHSPGVSLSPTIAAFEWSPDRGMGRALEEVGQPYEVRLLSLSEMKEAALRAPHPFRQILFRIAERHAGLLPDDANARARAIDLSHAKKGTRA